MSSFAFPAGARQQARLDTSDKPSATTAARAEYAECIYGSDCEE